MRSTSINTFFMASSAIGLTGGLFALAKNNPPLLYAVFVLSTLALAVRTWQFVQEELRNRSAGASVDFAALQTMDFTAVAVRLKEQVRGHDAEIDEIASNLRRGLLLAGPDRTLGQFLLVGPPGVGKTHLAVCAARALYRDSEPLILRMGQYKDQSGIAALIGQGGRDVPGTLTGPVLEDPRRVIIFDDVDRAHPEIQSLLCDVMDRGQCVELSSGRTAFFNACAFFATCDLAARDIDPATRGRDLLLGSAQLQKALLARFHDVLLLRALDPVQVAEVACLQLVDHWRRHGIEVAYADPELLFEALRRNSEFQEHGVRAMAGVIRHLTDAAVEGARRDGLRRVRLGIGAQGQVAVTAA